MAHDGVYVLERLLHQSPRLRAYLLLVNYVRVQLSDYDERGLDSFVFLEHEAGSLYEDVRVLVYWLE